MQLRRATGADALAVARVHVRSWQVGYRGLLADAYLDGLRAEDRAARYTFDVTDPGRPATLVAEADGAIVGFATVGPAREAEADVAGAGVLAALYVDPDAWGRGVGQALIARARAELADRGHTAAVLWVLAGNARALRFYERDGWRPDGRERRDTIWGATVDELRLHRPLP